jgi:hypothetical protein
LIISILFEQFIESWAVRCCCLDRQLKPKRPKQPGNFRKAQLSGASVLERDESGAANARTARELDLTQLELLAMLSDLAAQGEQI